MTTPCVHHWLIEPPAGRTSRGTCKRCGESRADFQNADARPLQEQLHEEYHGVGRGRRPQELAGEVLA